MLINANNKKTAKCGHDQLICRSSGTGAFISTGGVPVTSGIIVAAPASGGSSPAAPFSGLPSCAGGKLFGGGVSSKGFIALGAFLCPAIPPAAQPREVAS